MHRRHVYAALVVFTLTAVAGALPADAGMKRRPVGKSHASAVRSDCVPLNGRYGYYGNPWCDTGSYRLEDIWFRERQAAASAAGRKARH